jgi:hypothetical protein
MLLAILIQAAMLEWNFLQLVKNYHADLDVTPYRDDVTTVMQTLHKHLPLCPVLSALYELCLVTNTSTHNGLAFLQKENECTNKRSERRRNVMVHAKQK